MKNRIPYTSFSGISEQICATGNAVEFIQPWYTPISTTPGNTGIAVGGIGNTFTLTPLGNTPSFAFIPGIFIDNNDNQFNFNDFYISVADELSLEQLDIPDLNKLAYFLRFYPANFNGNKLEVTSKSEVLTTIKNALNSGLFYAENEQNFRKWKIEFTSKTQNELAHDSKSLVAQLLVAVDFFNGLLVNRSAEFKSLTAHSGKEKIEAVSEAAIEFSALYPMAEFDYSTFDDIAISRKVVSPIVRGDKKLCSLPMHWNEFEVTNNTSDTKVITLVQSLKNLIGSTYRKQRPGVQDSACVLTQNPVKQAHSSYTLEQNKRNYSGILQRSESGYDSDIDGEVLFGADVDSGLIESGKAVVSRKPMVYCLNEEQVIVDALRTGRVNQIFDKGIYSGREALASVVSIQLEIEPYSSASVRFIQVMDHSKVQLQDWVSEKAYAQFYPQSSKAVAILEDTFPELDSIEAEIVKNQNSYLNHARDAIDDEKSALQFATMAMNSLSFLSESTVWDIKNRFLVKECVDYPFFNSLDVYFYGSFALLYLLPELDGAVMREFSNAILAQDSSTRRFWEYEDKPYAELVDSKYEGVRGVRGAVIHDLGSPFDISPDAYTWHNVKEWKDLAPKFALMVYRHYQMTGDVSVIRDCWPAVKESIEYLKTLIAEGDVMPLTRGTDDTFDNLSSHGISIYCGSLWVAGLNAAVKLAMLMDEPDLAEEYSDRGKKSLDLLERGLWDESRGYFHFFITPIQSMHLTGEDYQELGDLGLKLTGDRNQDKEILNEYLDGMTTAGLGTQSRYHAKRLFAEVAPHAFTEEYKEILELDSENSFGDAMLANTYLRLLGMEGLFADGKVERTLDYIYKTNFKENSPKLGVANMTLSDGMPHHEFQAQDVWIGVQFSVATALRLAGKGAQAVDLMNTVYDALYHEAKIPFAAPEGFNCSAIVTADAIARECAIPAELANSWYQILQETNCLLADGRVTPDLVKDASSFKALIGSEIDEQKIEHLHIWLKNTGLKYTAGRYFRPGMIFSYLPEALV